MHTWISRIYHFHAVCIFFLYDSIIRSLLSYTPFSKSWLKNFIYTNGWKSNSFPTMKRSGLVMDFGLLGIGKKCAFEVTFIESHTLFSFCQQIPKKVLHTVFISDWGRNYGHLVRKSPSLHGWKSNPSPKFLNTAEAYFVCHIGPNFFDLCLHWVSIVHETLHSEIYIDVLMH